MINMQTETLHGNLRIVARSMVYLLSIAFGESLCGRQMVQGKGDPLLRFFCLFNKRIQLGAGELAGWLRALGALAEDPGLIASTHMESHICLQLQF